MEEWLDEFPEERPIYTADVEFLNKEICAEGNIQSHCSSKHAKIEMHNQQVANTDVKQRSYALGSRRNCCLVDSLQEALCAVKLDEAKPAWNCPNTVVPCDFRNFSILAQTYQNFINPDEKQNC